MVSFSRLAVPLLVFASCTMLTAAHAEEERISRNRLPPAVRKTADQQSKGAVVRAYTTEIENGRREYEVELVVNGHTKDVTIAPDGRVIEIEEQVDAQALPALVLSALRNKAGEREITKIESISKNGIIVAYEGQIRTSGPHSEIQVGPQGQNLSHEE